MITETFQVERGKRESDKEMWCRVGEGDAMLLALRLEERSMHRGMQIPFRFIKKKNPKEMGLPAMVWMNVPLHNFQVGTKIEKVAVLRAGPLGND